MKFGAIRNLKIQSPIHNMGQLRPSSSMNHVFKAAAPLMLTSLVDAFAVIVIYLLVTTQTPGKEMKVDKEISLPQSRNSHMLQPGVNVRVINSKYMINEKEMDLGELLAHLTELNTTLKAQGDEKFGNIVIQADKNSDYSKVSPVLAVAAQSGFENIKFAVIGE